MLFDVLPNYEHLVGQDGSTAGKLLDAAMNDFEEYERRLEQLSTALSAEFNTAAVEWTASLNALNELCRAEESAEEEAVIRQRVQANTRRSHVTLAELSQQGSPSPQGGDEAVHGTTSSRLTDFWKQKYNELQLELENAIERRAAVLNKLEDVQKDQSTTAQKTIKNITAINEKIIGMKKTSNRYVIMLRDLMSDRPEEELSPAVASATMMLKAEQSKNSPTASCEEEQGELQRILDALVREGECLSTLVAALAAREGALKQKNQKLQSSLNQPSGGANSNALEDVLYLRAEVRSIKEKHQYSGPTVTSSEAMAARSRAYAAEEEQLRRVKVEEEESLSKELESIQRRIREVRVSILRAEHRGRDGSMIVKKAVDEQRVKALKERWALLQAEKLRELELSNKVSLAAHFDAAWLVKASQ